MPDRNKMKKICGIIIAALAVLVVILAFPPGESGNGPAEDPVVESPILAAVESPKPTPTPAPTPAPTPTPTPPPTPTPTPEPEVFGWISEAGEPVEDDFFSDALFMGNSLVHGLWGFGGIKTADYAAATSASVVNLDRVRNEALWGVDKEDAPCLLDCLSMGSYGKVYILLGINEIGFEPADFISIYSGVLDSVEAAQPEADIYIMGLSPVTEEKDAAGWPFTMERVLAYNEALKTLAVERECYYLDLVEALADESGFLPEADSTDGIHLIREKYPKWADYLRSHYA